MTKKNVFFQETRGDKYKEGWLELEVHPIGDLKKQEKVK